MLYGLTHLIDEAAKDVPEVLWSTSAVRRMKSIVERFPDGQARTIGPVRLGVFGLEFRLAAGAEQVDLTFPILREDRDVIVHLGQNDAEGAWLRAEPAWSRVWRFCADWADAQTPLGRHVRLLWFEFDMDDRAASGALPAPGVFVGFEPEATRDADGPTWERLLTDVLRLLDGREASPALREHFHRCLGALPANAIVQYIGLMLTRGSEIVRFVFGNVAEAGWPDFLAAVGWPGQPDDLRETLRGVTRGATLHPGAGALQLDIGPSGALPRIGLEYALDRSVQATAGIRELSFLEHLVEQGFCAPGKLSALLHLPGRRLSVRREICQIGHTRQVHHVKLVVDPSGVAEAKAYYGRALAIHGIEGPAGSNPSGTATAG